MKEIKITEDMRIAAGESFKEREYWLEKFFGELSFSRFPGDSDYGGKEKVSEDSLEFEIPAELRLRMLKLCDNSDDRLFILLLTFLNILIYKYTGIRDIIIGTPIKKQEIEKEFINAVLPLRSTLRDDMSFKELLLEVRNTFHDALENQNYPFPVLLNDLNAQIETGRPGIFDTGILLENIQEKKYIGDLGLNMNFSFSREEDRIAGVIEYDAGMYEQGTITRILSHFLNVLDAVLLDVDIRIAGIEILSAEEQQEIAFTFNEAYPPVDYPGDKRIKQLFEEQVESTPDYIAVVFEDKQLTYRALNSRANRLAGKLKSKGVGPGKIAGMILERSLTMIEGIWGIIKSGGAYLPIDPAYPAERIRFVLKDSGAALVLVDDDDKRDLFKTTGVEFIDTGEIPGCGEDDANLPVMNEAEDMIYVIYTSGSTGRPKGVILEHGAVEQMLFWRQGEYGLTVDDCALQLFSYAFDGFVTSFFTPVLSGARVVLLSEKETRDVPKIIAAIAKNRVTHFISVPQFYREIIANMTGDESGSLKAVTLAGDRLTPDIAAESVKKNSGIEITHEYGVTEAAVISTILRNQEKSEKISIGKPAPHANVFILNDRDELLPVGVPGELCIGGNGLARGYLNKQELTDEKFIASGGPLFEKSGAKTFDKEHSSGFPSYGGVPRSGGVGLAPTSNFQLIYKTGDRARWLPGGKIEFMGRIDTQVKVRGFRIETGEIENGLCRHAGISKAAVIARENENGDKYLCAYIETKDELPAAEIIEYLSGILPVYMMPANFVVLDSLPLTPNGKIDRKSLKEYDDANKQETEYVAPRNDDEVRLTEIWQEELEKQQVGINDNYFNIGGDSIKAIRLVNKVNERFNRNLEIVDLYINNTIEKLAVLIQEKEVEKDTGDDSEILNEMEEMKNIYIEGLSDDEF